MDLFQALVGTVEPLLNQLVNQLLGQALAGLLGKRSLNLNLQDGLAFLSQLQTYFQGSIPNLFANVQGILQNYQTQITQFLTNLTSPQARSKFIIATERIKGDIDLAFRDFFSDALDWIQAQLAQGVNVLLATALNIYGLFGKRGIFDGITDAFSGIVSTLGGHLDTITSSLISLGGSLLDAVQPSLQDLQDQLTNHALNAAQSLLGTLAGISSTLQG